MVRPPANDASPFGAHAPGGVTKRVLDLTFGRSQGWMGKRGAFLLRAIAVRALRGRPLDVERLGARMRLYPRNNTSEKRILFTPQYFDAQELALLRARVTDDFTFIDVGASVGGYALAVAAVAGPGARILAIEPEPQLFERLVYNIRQNPFSRIKALACAVADVDGEITLFLNTRNRGEASMRIVTAQADAERIKVPAKPLAAIVAEEGFARLDAIKIDVEGAEDLIIEPFFREAPRAVWPGLIVMEHAPSRWALDLPRLIVERGYRELARTRDNIVFERV